MSYTLWHYRPSVIRSTLFFWSFKWYHFTLLSLCPLRKQEFRNKTNFIIIQSCIFYHHVSCMRFLYRKISTKKNWTKNHVIECCFSLSLSLAMLFCNGVWGMNAHQLNTYLSTKCVFVYCTAAQMHQTEQEQEQEQMHLLSHGHQSKLTRTIFKLSFFDAFYVEDSHWYCCCCSCYFPWLNSLLSFTSTKWDSSLPSL